MTKSKNELILWFDQLRNTDISIVGGKNASLGEMINIGIPVPPGFAITAYAYEKFIKETKIGKIIFEIIKKTANEHDKFAKFNW